jgi:hypothetical protein
MPHRQARIFHLVVALGGKADGKGFRPTGESGQHAGDGGAVEATGKEGPCAILPQRRLHALLEQRLQRLRQGGEGFGFFVIAEAGLPVKPLLHPSRPPKQILRRQKFLHALVDAVGGRHHVGVEIVEQTLGREPAPHLGVGGHRLQAAPEDDAVFHQSKAHGFDAHAIDGKEQCLLRRIHEGEGKGPAQALQHGGAALAVERGHGGRHILRAGAGCRRAFGNAGPAQQCHGEVSLAMGEEASERRLGGDGRLGFAHQRPGGTHLCQQCRRIGRPGAQPAAKEGIFPEASHGSMDRLGCG